MAFVVEDRWVVGRDRARTAAIPLGTSSAIAPPRRHRPRGIAALALTIIVHLLLAAALVSRLLTPDLASRHKPGAGPRLTLLDLGRPAEAQPAPPQPPRSLPAPIAPPTPPVDQAAAPSEWQSVPVRVARLPLPSAAAPTALPAAPKPATAGSGFDPYAGAAPNRPGEHAQTPSPVTPPNFAMAMLPRMIDGHDALLRAFVERFRVHHPSARGMAMARVEIGAGGRVQRVIAVAGTLSKEDQASLGSELLGATLAPAGTPAAVRMAGPMLFGS